MEEGELKIIWLKHCIKDFKNLKEEEFIAVSSKLKNALPNLIQNTSIVKGTKLRRLRIGNKRLFLKIIYDKIYCIGYKSRSNAYNKKQLQEMDKLIKKIITGEGL